MLHARGDRFFAASAQAACEIPPSFQRDRFRSPPPTLCKAYLSHQRHHSQQRHFESKRHAGSDKLASTGPTAREYQGAGLAPCTDGAEVAAAVDGVQAGVTPPDDVAEKEGLANKG